jgi:hypothetical protein
MALVSLSIMAMVAAAALYRVKPRMASTYHSASWTEALQSAEAGADMALQALNTATTDPATAWAAWTPSDAVTFPKTWTPVIAAHGGEGNTKVWCKVTIDNAITDANGVAWMRVRSMGVAELPAASRSGIDSAMSDADGSRSFRTVLRRGRFLSDLTGGALRLPQISRTIEAVAAPPGARLFVRAITVRGNINLTGGVLVDSYDSADPNKSTASLYDPAKQQSNGSIATNSAGGSSNLNDCTVLGDASSSGGAINGASGVSGTLYNNFSTLVPDVPVPNCAPLNFTPTVITNPGAPVTLVGGPVGTPQNYKVTDLTISSATGPLVLTPHAPGQESYINLWVAGRVAVSGTGYIEQQPGVHVQLFFEDDITIGGGGIVNQTSLPANLQLIGVTPASGTPTASISGNADFIGVLMAPAYDLTVGGTGKFCGAAVAKNAAISTSGGFHYDEDLANLRYNGTSGYQFASWMEDLH